MGLLMTSSPSGGSRLAPLKKLNGRHRRAAMLMVQGRSLLEISRELGYGPGYWARLRNQSPLFQECVEAYRGQAEQAFANTLDDFYKTQLIAARERRQQKALKRQRRMSRTRSLIRDVDLALRPRNAAIRSPALSQPVVSTPSAKTAPRAAVSLQSMDAAGATAEAENAQTSSFAKPAPPRPIPATGGQVGDLPRRGVSFQDSRGLSGRR